MNASLQVGLPSFTSSVNLSAEVVVLLGLFTVAFFACGLLVGRWIALAMPAAGCVGFLLASSFDGRVIRYESFGWILIAGSFATATGLFLRRRLDNRTTSD